MKVRIDDYERYPAFRVSEQYGHEVEVTPEQVDQWAKAEAAYEEAQREMDALWDAAEKAAAAERARIKAEQEAEARARREEEHRRAEAQNRRRRAAFDRLTDQQVYDAAGNPVGVVRRGSYGGLHLDVDLGQEPTT